MIALGKGKLCEQGSRDLVSMATMLLSDKNAKTLHTKCGMTKIGTGSDE